MHAHMEHTKDVGSLSELRKEAGKWLRVKREAAGLSQRQLASMVGIDYYTFISQLETGRGRVPPERFQSYAVALNVVPRDFALTMMRYNDPTTYNLIFGSVVETPLPKSSMESFEARLLHLEQKFTAS